MIFRGGGCDTIRITTHCEKIIKIGGGRLVDFTEIPFHKDDLDELLKLKINFAFQPIFYADDLELYGYEALMRPEGMSPLELIKEYEEKDKLFVIELATCFGSAMEYKKRGYTHDLCINSFPSEFMNEGQSKLYRDCFPDLAGKVVVEMVEYTQLNTDKWSQKKVDLDKHKMRVSIDDYSTGNNNMGAVDYFTPQYVKFDRSMISGIDKDVIKQNYVGKLVPYFHSKGIRIVAEGIEIEEELKYLQDYTEIDFFQGYYLGMPQ